MPVQDVYRFSAQGDKRRIIAGTIESGSICVGEEVVFYPSEKRSKIKTIEVFNSLPKFKAVAGEAVGFTLEDQIYIRPGEIMCSASQKGPLVGKRFRANIFWLGPAPMVKKRQYKLKIGTS